MMLLAQYAPQALLALAVAGSVLSLRGAFRGALAEARGATRDGRRAPGAATNRRPPAARPRPGAAPSSASRAAADTRSSTMPAAHRAPVQFTAPQTPQATRARHIAAEGSSPIEIARRLGVSQDAVALMIGAPPDTRASQQRQPQPVGSRQGVPAPAIRAADRPSYAVRRRIR